MTSLFQHMLGGLYGLALGDAWAAPSLATPAETWQAYGGWIDGLMPAPVDDQGQPGRQAGCVTAAAGTAFETIARLADGLEAVKTAGLELGLLPLTLAPLGLLFPGRSAQAGAEVRRLVDAARLPAEVISGGAALAAAWAAALAEESRLSEIISAGLAAAGQPAADGISQAVELAGRRIPPRQIIDDLFEFLSSLPASASAAAGAMAILAMSHGHPLQAAIYAAALSWQAHAVVALACGITGSWCGDDIFSASQRQTLAQANPQLDFPLLAKKLSARIES